VVQVMHLARRHASAKLDVLEPQLARKRLQRRSLWSISSQYQPRLRKALLDLREGAQNTRDVVERIHVAVRQKDRLQRFALSVFKPLVVDHVRDRKSVQAKLAEHINEVLRRYDDAIR